MCKQRLTMYTDLCLRASLYSSFSSGKGLFGDLLTFVLSSLISKRPVFDFRRAATMTLLSEVKDFSLGRQYKCFNKYSEHEERKSTSILLQDHVQINTNDQHEHAFFMPVQWHSVKMETLHTNWSFRFNKGLIVSHLYCLNQYRCDVSPKSLMAEKSWYLLG